MFNDKLRYYKSSSTTSLRLETIFGSPSILVQLHNIAILKTNKFEKLQLHSNLLYNQNDDDDVHKGNTKKKTTKKNHTHTHCTYTNFISEWLYIVQYEENPDSVLFRYKSSAWAFRS